jgi:hypothetical protein
MINMGEERKATFCITDYYDGHWFLLNRGR